MRHLSKKRTSDRWAEQEKTEFRNKELSCRKNQKIWEYKLGLLKEWEDFQERSQENWIGVFWIKSIVKDRKKTFRRRVPEKRHWKWVGISIGSDCGRLKECEYCTSLRPPWITIEKVHEYEVEGLLIIFLLINPPVFAIELVKIGKYKAVNSSHVWFNP